MIEFSFNLKNQTFIFGIVVFEIFRQDEKVSGPCVQQYPGTPSSAVSRMTIDKPVV